MPTRAWTKRSTSLRAQPTPAQALGAFQSLVVGVFQIPAVYSLGRCGVQLAQMLPGQTGEANTSSEQREECRRLAVRRATELYPPSQTIDWFEAFQRSYNNCIAGRPLDTPEAP